MIGVAAEEFKLTELGLLPREWGVVRSSEKLLLNDSGVWGDDLEEGESGVEVLRSTNMQNNNWVFEDVARRRITEEQFRRYWLRQGDILITKSSGSKKHIGKAAYVDGVVENRRCIFANFMQRLRFNNDIYPEFAFHFIISESGKNILLSRSTTTTGLRNLQKTDFENIIMPFPPFPEQKKIAYVLASVQTAAEKTEAVIEATKELKKSLMKHLFTYGPVSIDEAGNVPLKETEIGMVPDGWEVVPLGEVVTFSSKPRNLNLSASDNVPFVPMEYIPDDRIDISRYEMKKPGEIGSGTFFFKGDLLVAKITPSFENGKQCITNNLPSAFGYATTEVWPLHETKRADLLCLFYYLKRKEVRADVAGKMEGSTGRQRVPRRVLQNVCIPLPHLPIQKQIADILSLVDEKIETEQSKKKSLEALFNTLLSRLMAGKTRVNSLEVPL